MSGLAEVDKMKGGKIRSEVQISANSTQSFARSRSPKCRGRVDLVGFFPSFTKEITREVGGSFAIS